MVRLLLERLQIQFRIITFQSHNGAIAAKPTMMTEVTERLFQSHNGAIAASSEIC